ncbi:hypothetical protein M5D96_013394 [Drosophila gunungcola]|uniref:Uncharacterized protein n=1 Tax=Drosophila gunungcola TaxID=103775 RepID=A0A9Q0BJ65_9MUSC|nr:hypothetical protein M5D96_013394 [Drosophila gunungcola]
MRRYPVVPALRSDLSVKKKSEKCDKSRFYHNILTKWISSCWFHHSSTLRWPVVLNSLYLVVIGLIFFFRFIYDLVNVPRARLLVLQPFFDTYSFPLKLG